ncbi:MAG: response regulator transcription factor [Actinomycetes bacterium]
MRILIVEDDPGIIAFLDKGLRAEGYLTETTTSVAEAIAALSTPGDGFDLVLLDLGLPDGDGTDVLVDLRGRGDLTPVIMLTARSAVPDRVAGLNAGANDYIAKPFAFDELVARVRAALRTTEQPRASELVGGDLRLDLLTKVATRQGRRIELAQREWTLLELFLRHQGQVLSRSQILSAVWDYSFDPGSNVVDVYVGYLRRKIDLPGEPSMLQTVRGAGYRFICS